MRWVEGGCRRCGLLKERLKGLWRRGGRKRSGGRLIVGGVVCENGKGKVKCERMNEGGAGEGRGVSECVNGQLRRENVKLETVVFMNDVYRNVVELR